MNRSVIKPFDVSDNISNILSANRSVRITLIIFGNISVVLALGQMFREKTVWR